MKTLRLALAVLLAAFIIDGTVAQADTYYSRVNTNGDWHDQSTWSNDSCGGNEGSGVPGADDTAVICAEDTVDIDVNSGDSGLVIVDTVIIQDHATTPGTLDIQDSGKLRPRGTLDMQADLAEHGRIEFSAASTQAELQAHDTNLVIAGLVEATGAAGGKIWNSYGINVLTISGTGVVRTSDGEADGPIDIKIATEQDGLVEANVSGEIKYAITFTQDIRPGSSGRFKVSSANGIIKIDSGASMNGTSSACMVELTAGLFHVSGGDFLIDGGLYADEDSQIKADSNPSRTFEAAGPYLPVSGSGF